MYFFYSLFFAFKGLLTVYVYLQAEERIFDGDDRLAPVFVATLAAATLSQILFGVGGLIANDTTTATTTTTQGHNIAPINRGNPGKRGFLSKCCGNAPDIE